MVRHTSKKLLALLNHSFWAVHIAGRKQSFTRWGAHITGRNWAFSSAVEKLSRHCPGTEYQHKRGHTSNILCKIQKDSLCQCCIKSHWDITFQWREWQPPNGKMNVRWLSYPRRPKWLDSERDSRKMTSKIAPSEKFSTNLTESRHRIALSLFQNC